MHVVSSIGKQRVTKHRLGLCGVQTLTGPVKEKSQIPALSTGTFPLFTSISLHDDLRVALRFSDGQQQGITLNLSLTKWYYVHETLDAIQRVLGDEELYRRHTRMCDRMSYVNLIHGGGHSSTQRTCQKPLVMAKWCKKNDRRANKLEPNKHCISWQKHSKLVLAYTKSWSSISRVINGNDDT